MISLLIALLLCIYQSPILHLIKYVCFVLSTQKANECVLFVLLFFLFTSMQAAHKNWASVQFSSLAQSCPALCDPMNRSTLGLPIHHQLPEFNQTHVHWVSDAIQPSHPLSSLSPPSLNPSHHQGLFQWVNSSQEVDKVLEFQLQHQSFQWIPRTLLL